MLSGACVGSNTLEMSGQFYDLVLATIGMKRCFENEVEIGYASNSNDIKFWVLSPFDGGPATYGNGSQLMFAAADRESVKAFHRACLESGGKDEGSPGPRDYSAGYYGAYCRDLDGNKLHVFCICSE